MFKVSAERTQGDIFNLRARFDEALAAYLRGLRLLQGRPGESGRRAVMYARIAQVYVNADNPAKAIDSADLGLAEQKMSLRSLASLQFTRAIALVRIGRDREGIDIAAGVGKISATRASAGGSAGGFADPFESAGRRDIALPSDGLRHGQRLLRRQQKRHGYATGDFVSLPAPHRPGRLRPQPLAMHDAHAAQAVLPRLGQEVGDAGLRGGGIHLM